MTKSEIFLNNFRQYYSEIENKFHQRPSRWLKAVLFCDLLMAYFIHGASARDYLGFEFWRKSHLERKSFLTSRRFRKLQLKYNNKKSADIFRDKSLFNVHFNRFLKRAWLDPRKCDYEKFLRFITKQGKVIVKPHKGTEGEGIYILDATDKNVDIRQLFNETRLQKEILEELISPGTLSEFNPSTINSIRVVTLLVGDQTEIKFASLKMGNGNAKIDNFASGSIVGVIDISTGIVITRGNDIKRRYFIEHPVSRKQIIGYKIPKWEEILKTVKSASKIVPEVRYVGWDVSINASNEVVIIEGNHRSDRAIQVHDQIGRRYIFGM